MAASAGSKRGKGWKHSALGLVGALVIMAADLAANSALPLGLLIPAAYLGLIVFFYRSELDQALLTTGICAGVLTLVGGAGAMMAADIAAILDRVVYALALVVMSTILFSALKQQRALRALSTIDVLTGALHEPAFIAQIAREAIRVRRYRSKLSIIMAEIDNYAEIEKSRGAGYAEQLLASLAKVCVAGIRPTDLFGRADNRLLIAMPETTELGSSTVAERLRSVLTDPALLPEGVESFDATVSFGVSWIAERDKGSDGVMSRAETALRASQAKGPGSISTLIDDKAA
jgi:diguanylate cyclase (GGDEF)-like protein